MKEGFEETNGEQSQEQMRRRGVLATVAAAGAGGLAGCPNASLSDSDDDEEGTEESDGTETEVSCVDVTNGYDLQDVGARPIIFDFEYPAIFDELEYIQAAQATAFEGSLSIGNGSIDITITQNSEPNSSGGNDVEQGESGTTTEFNGEEVEFTGFSSGSELAWYGNLPYQLDGERVVFPVTVGLTTSGESSNDCGDALRGAAEHIVDSMAVNTETTLGSGGTNEEDQADEDGGDASDDLFCTDITKGYDQQDVGARPIIFDFEYPSVFDELEFIQAAQLATFEGTKSSDDVSIDFTLSQNSEPDSSDDDLEEGTSGTSTEFNGEVVEFTGFSSGSELTWFGSLPYQVAGEREVFPVTLGLSISGDSSNACGDALRRAAEHIVDSMVVNTETTLGSGGSDDDDDGTDDASSDLFCTNITNGYDLQDVGARPVIFDFEYPAMFDDLEYIQTAQVSTYEASQAADDVTVDITISQISDPDGSAGGGSNQGASGVTTEFNGEVVEFTGFSSGSDLSWYGDLPYQLDGERVTLPVTVAMSISGESSNTCGDALREAAEHIVDSMVVNTESTLDS